MNRRCRGQGSGVRGQGPVSLAAKYLLLALLCTLALLSGACGKKMMPLPADKVLPAPVRQFKLSQEGDSLVLSWLLPRVNLLGQPLTQVQGCRVYRAEVRGMSSETPCPTTSFVLSLLDAVN